MNGRLKDPGGGASNGELQGNGNVDGEKGKKALRRALQADPNKRVQALANRKRDLDLRRGLVADWLSGAEDLQLLGRAMLHLVAIKRVSFTIFFFNEMSKCPM
jgi:hypothetical protein